MRRRLWLFLKDGWRVMLAGFLAMLALWHSVEVGLYVLAAGTSFSVIAGLFQGRGIKWRRRPLPLISFILGAFFAFWAVGWYFVLHGALGDMFRNLWVQCIYQVDTWGLAMPGFHDAVRPMLIGPERPEFTQWIGGNQMSFYIGAVALTVALAVLVCRAFFSGFWRSRWAPYLLLMTLCGVFFSRTVLGRSDVWHTHYGVFFSTLLGLFFVAALAGRTWDIFTTRGMRLRERLVTGVFLCMLSAGGLILMGWYVHVRWQPMENLSGRWDGLPALSPATTAEDEPLPRAGVLHMAGQAEAMEPVIDYIRENTASDERIFDFSNQALWLFFADRRSASRYYLVAYASLPQLQKEVIADLERHSVNLVIYSGDTWFDRIDGVPQNVRHPLIADYLVKNFEEAEKIGRVRFWRRVATQ